jgi:uncharacterized membrane protein
MTSKMAALLLGGLMPALIYGCSAIFQKMSINSGISLSAYLVATGVGIIIVGAGYYFFDGSFTYNAKSGIYAIIFGLAWGVASGLVAYTLLHFDVALSQLVPLYNMNTLVAVLLALIIFSEWRDLHTIKLIAGTLLISVGAILVANA